MKLKMALPFTAAALALAACGHHGGDANSSDATANSDAGTPVIETEYNASSEDPNATAPLENTADANAADGGTGNAQ